MKVYELMEILAAAPAGMDVQVCVSSSMGTRVLGAGTFDDHILLQGGDVELVNDEGNSIGFLSGLIDNSSEE